MNIFKNCTPCEDGYYWHRAPGVTPTIARISKPTEPVVLTGDEDADSFNAARLVWFVGANDEVWDWELSEQYEFAGPIFPPTDWPLELEKWPL